MSDDLRFSVKEVEEGEKSKRQNAKELKAHLEPKVLRTNPEASTWLNLTPRIAALGMDAFERAHR